MDMSTTTGLDRQVPRNPSRQYRVRSPLSSRVHGRCSAQVLYVQYIVQHRAGQYLQTDLCSIRLPSLLCPGPRCPVTVVSSGVPCTSPRQLHRGSCWPDLLVWPGPGLAASAIRAPDNTVHQGSTRYYYFLLLSCPSPFSPPVCLWPVGACPHPRPHPRPRRPVQVVGDQRRRVIRPARLRQALQKKTVRRDLH